MAKIIGDKGKSIFDPDLAREINEKFERESRKAKLEGKVQSKEPPIVQPENKPTPITNLNNPEDYMILEGKTYDNYSYPDLLVSKYRLGSNLENYPNTGKEANGREYIGNIDWKTALTLNLNCEGFTLNPRQFIDFLKLLKSGKVYDGKGNKINSIELENIYNEITQVRDPWRSEWLDAKFKEINNGLYLFSKHKLENGALVPKYKEIIEPSTLMKDKLSGINLDSLLKTANKQGFPTNKTKNGQLYYWNPENGRVAGFDAGSGRADLYCGGDPDGSSPALGVRFAREK
ncbi:MAG: hypothetical protein PHD81_03050 [Candidatus Nanoarchaeia archaeon]|nr:hypothetical protein [Candidatus Nanoarchaeia archaeon]MDD5588062.1 hypothetical protein [Candidatus Nanoarchaeia archaeon]